MNLNATSCQPTNVLRLVPLKTNHQIEKFIKDKLEIKTLANIDKVALPFLREYYELLYPNDLLLSNFSPASSTKWTQLQGIVSRRKQDGSPELSEQRCVYFGMLVPIDGSNLEGKGFTL